MKIQTSIYIVGVVIHKNLTWNEHIESLIAKVNQRIGLLNRIKHLLPLDARVALYNALWAGPLEKLCGGRGGGVAWGERGNFRAAGIFIKFLV